MNYKFGILFKLQGRHRYFKDGFCRGLSFRTTPQLQNLLAGIDGRVQRISGGFAIMCSITDKVSRCPQPIAPIAPGTSGLFTIEVEDNLFYNYTDVPFPSQGKVLYANNLGTRKKVVQKRWLDLRPAMFSLEIDPKYREGLPIDCEYYVAKMNGEGVKRKKVSLLPGSQKLEIDLRNEAPGAYDLLLTLQGEKYHYPFFMYQTRLATSVLGFFEWFALKAPGVFPEDTMAKQGISKRIKLGESYQIEFKTKETKWQYYLVKSSKNRLQNPRITYYSGREKKFEFERSEQPVLLPNGLEALEFVAKKCLPFEEFPNGEVVLEAKGFSRNFRLPYASPQVYTPSPQSKHDKSNVYIYL